MTNKMLKIAYDPIYAHPLPEGHRFPMLKYELIPAQLLHEGSITADNIFSPGICPDEIILLTHEKEYLERIHNQTLLAKEQRHIGFPQSPALTLRELMIAQGTIDCCNYAFQNGVALNVAGGTHHAFANRGEGFCMLNDMAIAANYLLHKNIARQILIIDLDVHQGNGTASLFEQEKRVFTLKDGIADKEYLDLLKATLPKLLQEVRPDFAFYLSGVDILNTDRYGKLKVSPQGCIQRDEFVFTTLQQHGVPCAVAMGGGYSADVKIITEAHCNTFRVAQDIYGV